MRNTVVAVGMMAVLLMASKAQALLIDRSNGLVFDSASNLSWTKDGNLSGSGTWDDQTASAEGFSLAGFNDFRLPSITELAELYSQLPGAAGSNKTGNQGPFTNIQSGYWSNTVPSPNVFSPIPGNNVIIIIIPIDWGQTFSFQFGGEGIATPTFPLWGWAVRDGDSVASVPEPVSLLLMGLGLVGIRLAKQCVGQE